MVLTDPLSVQHCCSDHDLVPRLLQIKCRDNHTSTLCTRAYMPGMHGSPFIIPVWQLVRSWIQLQGSTVRDVIATRSRLRAINVTKLLLELIKLNASI